MKAQTQRVILFLINIFLLTNFIVGTLLSIFTPDRHSPVPETLVIVLVGVVTAVFTRMNIFPES